jgi:hypothetical protein
MNSPPQPWQAELTTLCDAVIEDRATAEQLARLETLVLQQPEAKRFYIEYLHQHGCLHWSAAQPALRDPSGVIPRPAAGSRETIALHSPWKRRLFWTGTLLAASLLAAFAFTMAKRPPAVAPVPTVATLAGASGCKWDSGTLPTEEGARLGAGRLRLAEGIIRIKFDNGVTLTVEAPADLEIESAQRCVLHGGRLIAKVPPPAIGFTVDTPTAVLHDLGTEFGVNVRGSEGSDVQVFEGIVDVQHRKSGKTERMKTGNNRRFEANKVDDFDPNADKPASVVGTPTPEGTRVVHLTTAMGKGKDAYVQRLYPSEHFSDILLLIKNATNEDYARKVYLGFDLAPVKGKKILDAQLSVTFAPTGMGFASEVGDCTFAVYGLTDEKMDDWNDRTVRWKGAPANVAGGARLDLKKVTRLGSFDLARGVQQGVRSIATPELVDFLQKDTNGLATVIVVRETLGSGRYDLVHGFAGKNHPTLPPPTLKLTVGKADE